MLNFHQAMEHEDTNDNVSIEIISTTKDNADLKIAESIYIRELKPNMNSILYPWKLIWFNGIAFGSINLSQAWHIFYMLLAVLLCISGF